MSVVLTDKDVVCRKSHRCEWCGENINKGETAHFQSGVFDGEFYSGRTHMECHSAMMDSIDDLNDGYYPFEQKRGMTYEQSHA